MTSLCALLYAAATAVLLSIVLAFAEGGLSPRAATFSLAVGSMVASFTFWSNRERRVRLRSLGAWEWAAVIAFALFSLRAFLWLVFFVGDEIRVLSPNNLGDLSLHVTYIRALANGVPFWPENPILAGTPLTYPLGVDLLHSLLVLAGADLWRTFLWMGLIGAALTGVALWRWGGAFTLAGFLFNGGLAGFAIFATGEFADYQAAAGWKSLPLALFVTQRGLLFALPAGLALLCSWRARFFQMEGSARLPLWGELLLYASMPVFHLHTFIFLSLLLAAWFFLHPPARWEIMRLVALALVPASALVFLVTGRFGTPSVIGWQPGWMQSDPEFLKTCEESLGITSPWITAPLFWVYNFGALPVLVAILLARIFRAPAAAHPAIAESVRFARAAAAPALGIFLLCCFVKFAPWEWDNTKLMIWSYLIVLPLLWQQVLARLRTWPRVAIGVVLFGSGAVSLVGGLDGSHRGFEIGRRSELETLESALRGLPPNARFVAHPNYNHPLLLLGRPVALGYTGHVWSHGYDWHGHERRVEAVFRGEPGWRETARGLGCRYLIWGREEQAAYPDSPQAWREEARRVASGSWGELDDLEPAR